ncbi:MAG: thioesterase family protein [Actinobacteria bacterium]|nr:thioesterase family protein [Actinomycetota bacterium]
MPTTQKIRYSDCDPQGIVFNANFARYWDDAVTDWFEELGFGGTELGGIGVDVVTARLEIDFKAAAKLGDTLVTEAAVERFGDTSMTVLVTTSRQSDSQIVAEGKAIYVFVDPAEFRPITVPESFREAVR